MAVNVVTVNGISCRLAGGVRETTDTIGTGTYSLRGARTVDLITYRTVIAGIGSGNASVFTVRLGSQFETFIGTVTSGTPATLTRQQILESSNSDTAVSWGSGDKDLILDAPAAVFASLQTQTSTVQTQANSLQTQVNSVSDQADDLQAQINAITGAGPAQAVTRSKTTVFTSGGTLTTDADTMFALVRIVGGGGAGGGAGVTNDFGASEGGGGGGGEYAEGFFTAAQLGASKGVTIGAGGTGVSASTGNTGGTTNFGSGLLTAVGGSGGSPMTASNTDNSAPGGAGGTGGTGGHFRVKGGSGFYGIVRRWSAWPGPIDSGVRGQQGCGGSSVLGHAQHTPETPGAGQLYGSGGNGASIGASVANRAGGAGAAGVCIVIEYLHA